MFQEIGPKKPQSPRGQRKIRNFRPECRTVISESPIIPLYSFVSRLYQATSQYSFPNDNKTTNLCSSCQFFTIKRIHIGGNNNHIGLLKIPTLQSDCFHWELNCIKIYLSIFIENQKRSYNYSAYFPVAFIHLNKYVNEMQ